MVILWGWVLDVNPTFFLPQNGDLSNKLRNLPLCYLYGEIANQNKSQTIFHIIVLPLKLLFAHLRTTNNKSYVE